MENEARRRETEKTLLRGFAHMGLGTLVSRASGFVREIVTAALFGAGTEMDIFVAAFRFPNLICRVLGESAVESGFMPLFKGQHVSGEKARAWRLAARTGRLPISSISATMNMAVMGPTPGIVINSCAMGSFLAACFTCLVNMST